MRTKQFTVFRLTNAQRGQALVEFVVWSITLIPCLLMVGLLGKYGDINQTAQQASRYVAWEKTVTTQDKINAKTDVQMAEEIRARFFANVGRPIKTSDVIKDENADDLNTMHVDHHGNRLIKALDDITVTTKRSAPVFGVKGSLLSNAGTTFNLPSDNLWRAEIKVTVVKIPFLAPLDRLNLNVTRYNTILADAWEAGSVAEEVATLKSATTAIPTTALATEVHSLTGWMKGMLLTIEPAFKDFSLDRFTPDTLPIHKDRR